MLINQEAHDAVQGLEFYEESKTQKYAKQERALMQIEEENEEDDEAREIPKFSHES